MLTGSTNFSVTGFYVNSNHVLVYDDPEVAAVYAQVFQACWDGALNGVSGFRDLRLATLPSKFEGKDFRATTITFSPHTGKDAVEIFGDMVGRIRAEMDMPDGEGSFLFAVMQFDGGAENPVYDALNTLHADQSIFSISDTPDGISLYPVGKRTGVLVTGKPIGTQLPAPFNQIPGVGLGHQVHPKFVVCGFNGPDPVVYCGSSNLALTGEQVNGDNLLAIRDTGVAAVFTVEASALVDHFDFLNRVAKGKKTTEPARSPAPLKQQAAVAAGWFRGTTDAWADKYFLCHRPSQRR